MARVTIATSGHLSTSPRAWHEAEMLAAAGHDVTVMGVVIEDAFVPSDAAVAAGRRWRWVPVADVRGGAGRAMRARARLGRVLLGRLGVPDGAAFGYAVSRLRRAVAAGGADYVIGHLETGLLIAADCRAAGRRHGIDVDDWYAEDRPRLAPSSRERRWLDALLGDALRGAGHATTTSRSLAAALAARHGTPEPGVVYNGSPVGAPVPAPEGPLRCCWVSQTVGPGRGLETLLPALAEVPAPWQLTLVGRVSEARRDALLALLPAERRAHVTFRGWVEPLALDALLAGHDVGLALERPEGGNKQHTASNKLVQSLQAGLHVVATATAGQQEVLALVPGGGVVVPSGDVRALAEALRHAAEAPVVLRAARAAVAAAAAAHFSLEAQAPAFVARVERAIAA